MSVPSTTFATTASPSASVPARAAAMPVLVAWPSLAETVLAIAAIVVIFPWFAVFAVDESGRDYRFAEATFKNEAMRDLLATAGWQWGAWMLAGLVLVKLSRTRLPASVGVAFALATWAVAAWAGRVPWPLAHDRTFVVGTPGCALGRDAGQFRDRDGRRGGRASGVVPWLRKPLAPVPQTLSSRIGYPGFVVATGIGWLLLLDLSANGKPGNRYLALYHHGHLWLAMLV